MEEGGGGGVGGGGPCGGRNREVEKTTFQEKDLRGQYVMAVAIAFDASSSGLVKQPKQVTGSPTSFYYFSSHLHIFLTNTSNFSFFWYSHIGIRL